MKIKFDENGNPIEEASKKERGAGSALTGILLILVIVLAGGLGYVSYRYYQMNKQFKTVADPKAQTEANKQLVAETITKVKKHMMLPIGEEPTIATITDAAALIKEQEFYKGAQNGDQVLLYMKAKKAIIYSPSRDLIVNAGPIYVNDNAAPAASKATTPAAKAPAKEVKDTTTTTP